MENTENFKTESPLSVTDWMIALFIRAIPLVGLVMLLIWGLGSNENTNKANWAKASLIWLAVRVVLAAIFWFVFVSAILSNSEAFEELKELFR